MLRFMTKQDETVFTETPIEVVAQIGRMREEQKRKPRV